MKLNGRNLYIKTNNFEIKVKLFIYIYIYIFCLQQVRTENEVMRGSNLDFSR